MTPIRMNAFYAVNLINFYLKSKNYLLLNNTISYTHTHTHTHTDRQTDRHTHTS